MIEVQVASMSVISNKRLGRTREVVDMKAFAFQGVEYGNSNPTATSKDVDRSPIGTDWFGKRVHANKVFTPLEDAEFQYFPSVVTVDNRRFKLTPWAGYAAHWSVSRAVKEVIDSFEPGKHQFIPVKLRYGHGEQFEEHQYYTLQVNTMENAVDLEKSDVTWSDLPEGRGRYWLPKAAVPVVLPKASVAGRHLWRNERISKWMMSGDLHDALVAHGLTGGLTFEEHFVI